RGHSPIFPSLAWMIAIIVGTLFLVRRFPRTQNIFAEQTLARAIIRRWEWVDMEPPKDLHDAWLIHTVRSQDRQRGHTQVLQTYEEAVRDALASGFVTTDEVTRLTSLRHQLQISEPDNEKAMAALADEERALFAGAATGQTSEKRLQLQTYEHALARQIETSLSTESEPNPQLLKQLQSEFGITSEEHELVL